MQSVDLHASLSSGRARLQRRYVVLLAATTALVLVLVPSWKALKARHLESMVAEVETAISHLQTAQARIHEASTAPPGSEVLEPSGDLLAERATALEALRETMEQSDWPRPSVIMDVLAREPIEGLWLTSIEYSAGEMILKGVALREAHLPRLLGSLRATPELACVRRWSLEAERQQFEPRIGFTVIGST